MSRTFLTALAAGALAAFSSPALAEPVEFFQVEGVSYDPEIPVFEEFAGYEIGERPVRYADLVGYIRMLGERSDRLDVETIGFTHEGRPILTATVTSADNHANLGAIRENHFDRLDGNAGVDVAPMILWINFGVHGAESSGMEAAIPAAYHYAAAQGPAVEAQLDGAVTLFTVAFNPDGHVRRIDHRDTYWTYADNPDPTHATHNLWVDARVNHYWFDLNRQWLLLTQPESQAWIEQWHYWKPMVSADYHEMGSSAPFYFHPGEPLRRNPLIPQRARDLTFGIGERHAEFFDGEARLYTTEERFDNFYIGKGSTYPQINGSLGILFEIGAARGGAIDTDRGRVEQADNVRSQFRTVITTIQGSLDQRDEIASYQQDFFAENERMAAQANQQGWVFTAQGDRERAARFVRLLRMHDIEVSELGTSITVDGQRFEAGESYVVPLAQMNYRMIRGIFDRVREFEEEVFYDVSGWTLPLAYDLEYAPLRGRAFNNASGGALADGAFESAPAPDVAPYGYVFNWSHTYAPRALNRVLSAGLMARAAMEEANVLTTTGSVDLERGAIFIPLVRQSLDADEIHALMETIAAEDGVEVHAARSGLTPTTGRDLGASNIFRSLEQPRIVLAFDGGLTKYDSGEMWWTLDYRHRMPVTLVEKDNLGRVDWDNYTHLILVGGNSALSERQTETVTDWVRSGGTLIATRDGARWAQREIMGHDDHDGGEHDGTEETARYNFEEMAVRDAEHVIGGAMFQADLDTTHPLGFGYSNRFLTMHRNEVFTLARPHDNPYAVPVEYTNDPLLSGYASEMRQEQIAGTPSVVAERMGRGAVILMADNPVFRGTYPGTEKLLMNAIFFSNLIDRPRGEYEVGDHEH